MQYEHIAIGQERVPRAAAPVFQHLVDTYASETNKTASLWRLFTAEDLLWRPHPRSSTVEEIMKHQLLSERRFFSEFLSFPEPPAAEVLPAGRTPEAFTARLVELAIRRLAPLAARGEADWLQPVNFFGVKRERIWIFWRRVLHSAHHRTQLTVYLRLLGRAVPSTYGPTADVTWSAADPTTTVEAAGRGSV
ncbi:MAG: DinB family protein [Acidobacteriia bacterium]|nr:DinB family protein [Terriglobia bacterium]